MYKLTIAVGSFLYELQALCTHMLCWFWSIDVYWLLSLVWQKHWMAKVLPSKISVLPTFPFHVLTTFTISITIFIRAWPIEELFDKEVLKQHWKQCALLVIWAQETQRYTYIYYIYIYICKPKEVLKSRRRKMGITHM